MTEKKPKGGDSSGMPDVDKAAVLLLSMEPRAAAAVMKQMNPREIHLISNRMSQMEDVPVALVRRVAEEFMELMSKDEGVLSGGAEYAKALIQRALDKEQAEYIISNLTSELPSSDLTIIDALRTIDPDILADFIKGEHPQTIAIIVAYMQPDKAAVVLSHLGQEMKNEIMVRMAELDQVPSDVLQEVAHVLKNELQMSAGLGKKMGGAQPVAEILNQLDSQSEKEVLAHMEEINPALADEIRKLMFVFEDLNNVDDRGVQQLLREIDSKTLGIALRGATEEVKEKFLRNMSSRASEMLLEDMEAMGPTRLSDVETSQQEIIRVARKLEEEGRIVVAGKGGDEVLV
jgi:flagellar motor switch protein FliG